MENPVGGVTILSQGGGYDSQTFWNEASRNKIGPDPPLYINRHVTEPVLAHRPKQYAFGDREDLVTQGMRSEQIMSQTLTDPQYSQVGIPIGDMQYQADSPPLNNLIPNQPATTHIANQNQKETQELGQEATNTAKTTQEQVTTAKPTKEPPQRQKLTKDHEQAKESVSGQTNSDPHILLKDTPAGEVDVEQG